LQRVLLDMKDRVAAAVPGMERDSLRSSPSTRWP